MAAKVVVRDTKRYRRVNAQMPQVRARVTAVTEAIGAAAEARFAEHDRPGGHRIEILAPTGPRRRLRIGQSRVDGLVALVGPDPLAVEFGHHESGKFGNQYGDDLRWIRGLHVLQVASGFAGGRG